jgi:hypothetical protein
LGTKVKNWIRSFGIDPSAWEVADVGGTAWISRRPLQDLPGLEKNMPNLPRKNESEECFNPAIRQIKEVYDGFDGDRKAVLHRLSKKTTPQRGELNTAHLWRIDEARRAWLWKMT